MDSILSSFLVLCLHVLRGFSSTSMDTKHHDAAYNIRPANTKTSLKHSEIKTQQLSFSSFFSPNFSESPKAHHWSLRSSRPSFQERFFRQVNLGKGKNCHQWMHQFVVRHSDFRSHHFPHLWTSRDRRSCSAEVIFGNIWILLHILSPPPRPFMSHWVMGRPVLNLRASVFQPVRNGEMRANCLRWSGALRFYKNTLGIWQAQQFVLDGFPLKSLLTLKQLLMWTDYPSKSRSKQSKCFILNKYDWWWTRACKKKMTWFSISQFTRFGTRSNPLSDSPDFSPSSSSSCEDVKTRLINLTM